MNKDLNIECKNIEKIALNKMAKKFLKSIKKAKYLLNEKEKEIELLKTNIDENNVKIYVYFDDEIEGILKDISLIDEDGDKVATLKREIKKEIAKGFYVMFRYKFIEEEDTNE